MLISASEREADRFQDEITRRRTPDLKEKLERSVEIAEQADGGEILWDRIVPFPKRAER